MVKFYADIGMYLHLLVTCIRRLRVTVEGATNATLGFGA